MQAIRSPTPFSGESRPTHSSRCVQPDFCSASRLRCSHIFPDGELRASGLKASSISPLEQMPHRSPKAARIWPCGGRHARIT